MCHKRVYSTIYHGPVNVVITLKVGTVETYGCSKKKTAYDPQTFQGQWMTPLQV